MTFEEATDVFYDAARVEYFDDGHSEDEGRYGVIGFSLKGRLLIVSFTPRGERLRIISARKAERDEERNAMSKVPEKWKLTSKARLVPKDQRHQPPPRASEPRNIKVKISMYVDLDVLDYFKTRAADMPYQTQINTELRRIMEREQAGEGADPVANLRQAKGLIESALKAM